MSGQYNPNKKPTMPLHPDDKFKAQFLTRNHLDALNDFERSFLLSVSSKQYITADQLAKLNEVSDQVLARIEKKSKPQAEEKPAKEKSPMARCRSCQQQIVFLKTASGKNMPVDYSGQAMDDQRDHVLFDGKRHVSHFSTCPEADKHRSKSK